LGGLEVEEDELPLVDFGGSGSHIAEMLPDEVFLTALTLPFMTAMFFTGSVLGIDQLVACRAEEILLAYGGSVFFLASARRCLFVCVVTVLVPTGSVTVTAW
jgi:hypothetical protein